MVNQYDMDQHSQSANMKFLVSFTYGNQNTPQTVVHCEGITDTFGYIPFWASELTLDKMFEMFIIEGRNKHTIMYIDGDGELVLTIKIIKEY